MESNERATLNYDCNYNLLLAKRLIKNMRKLQGKELQRRNDRKLVVQWLKYLMAFDKSIVEMEIRNDLMHHLVLNMQREFLEQPFDSAPSAKMTISELAQLIPSRGDNTISVEEMMEEINGTSKKPLVMEKSPDGGAFFSMQPMPHEGSFCYLTISTKKKRNSQ